MDLYSQYLFAELAFKRGVRLRTEPSLPALLSVKFLNT
jgi:hypothetical protein